MFPQQILVCCDEPYHFHVMLWFKDNNQQRLKTAIITLKLLYQISLYPTTLKFGRHSKVIKKCSFTSHTKCQSGKINHLHFLACIKRTCILVKLESINGKATNQKSFLGLCNEDYP